MPTNPKDLEIVEAIKKRYGRVIDLDKSPNAVIEIIHNYRHLLDEVAGPDGTGGGPGGPPPPPPGPARPDVGTPAILNLLLELQRDVRALNAKVK